MFMLDQLQDALNFEGCVLNVNYNTSKSIGRIGLTGYLIGLFCGIHLTIWVIFYLFNIQSPFCNALSIWSEYFFCLTLFHFMEFFVTSLYQPSTLNYGSFIVNHSKSYTIAALTSWLEYWIEYFLFGPNKYILIVNRLGFFLTLLGQVVRSYAMCQCGENFSHQIADSKSQEHQLVTNGIYRYLRHPSYFGWFYWSVGTQILLCNPICTIAYFYVSWSFFKDRIEYEEKTLVRFFGEKYIDYCQTSYIGIPFLKSSFSRSK